MRQREILLIILIWGLLLPLLVGCAPRQAPEVPKIETPARKLEGQERGRVELTVDEEGLRKRLASHVEELADKIGERNAAESWQLAEAADYIALQLEDMGFPVERQGYETEDVAAQNLSVTIPGGIRGDEILLVGVHYDSKIGSAARSGSATDTAVLLELARLLQSSKLFRTLRFSFFAMGESPHGDGAARGARQYLRSLKSQAKREAVPGLLPAETSHGAEVLGFISLQHSGCFRAERSEGGAFVTAVQIASSPGSRQLDAALTEAFTDEGIDPSLAPFATLSEGSDDSDSRAFYSEGIPVTLISGSNCPKSDKPSTDLSDLARIVMRLRRAIGQIVGEKLTNDGMLTPGGVVLQ